VGHDDTPATVPVWDGLVRVLHWALVAALAAAWLTTEVGVGWHQPLGWLALAVVALRGLWGLIGPRHARFARFVRAPRQTWAYLHLLCQRRAPRHLGHNPLGAWMILALLGCVAALALSGWLYTTDRFWGDASVEQCHRALAWALPALAALHVAGVVLTGRRHGENLVRAMLSGRKRAPAPGDVA
jgi:cytochrome b